MQQQQNQPKPSEQIKNISEALQRLLMQRSDLHDQLAANEKQLTGMRAALEGVQLGQAFSKEQAEVEAAQKAAREEPVKTVE